MEEKRSSRKRKHEEIDMKYVSKKFDEFNSIIREIRKYQKNSLEINNSSNEKIKKFSTCDKIEIDCCCKKSNKKFCDNENRNNFIDVKLVAALKNNEISINQKFIHRPFIDEWIRIAKESFSDKEFLLILTKYENNDNCLDKLKAPKLNEKLQNLVDEKTLKIDEMNATKQNNIALLLSIIEKVLSIIVQNGKQSTEVSKLIELLNDIGRFNAKIYHDISIERRKSILSCFDIEDKNDLSFVGDELFSSIIIDRLILQQYCMESINNLRDWEKKEFETLRRTMQTRETQTQTLPIMSNSFATQTDEIIQRTENCGAMCLIPTQGEVAQNRAVARNDTVPQNYAVAQNCAVAQNRAVTQNSAVAQNCAVAQNSAVAQNRAVTQNSAVAQNCAVARNSAVAQNCAVAQIRTVAQNYKVVRNGTVAQNIEETNSSVQEYLITKERAAAKIEETRVTKEETSFQPYIPGPKEQYPGARELVKRALKVRGIPEKYPQVKDSTWKNYEKGLFEWWAFCQLTKTDLANPSADEFARFYKKLREIGVSINDCRPALRRIIPETIVMSEMIRKFYAIVKEEKNK